MPGLFDFTGVGQIANETELPSPGGATPGNVVNKRLIQTDQAIRFDFQWTVAGIFAHVINPALKWKIEIFFEQYGGGEFNHPSAVRYVPYSAGVHIGPNQVQFGVANPLTTRVPIGGSTVPEGIYDIVALITLVHPDNSPCFLAAFAEFNKVAFYREHTAI